MNRLLFFVAPLLVTLGVLAYEAYQGSLDAEEVVGVVVFLIVAALVGIFGYRLSQKQSGP